MKKIIICLALAATVAISGCNKNDDDNTETVITPTESVFVVNEGNWGGANASLTLYNPVDKTFEQGVFSRANGAKLGDTGQSMTIANGKGYVVVNNSGVVFVVDPATLVVQKTIDNLSSPRFVTIASKTKGYISDMYASKITTFNPTTGEVTGSIATNSHPSTEQMVVVDGKMFVNCWSYDNTILVIDLSTDKIVKQIEVGVQPYSIVVDCNKKLWCMTDGGWEGCPAGNEAPRLMRINTSTYAIEKSFEFGLNDYFPTRLALNGAGDTIYYVDQSVWAMSVTADALPTTALITSDDYRSYYGIGVDPYLGDIYLSDAKTYDVAGVAYRYSSKGELKDSFATGICPSWFCFR